MDFIFARLIAKSTVYISSAIDHTEDDDRFLHLVHRVEDFKIIDGHGTHLGMFRKTSSTGRTLPSVKSAKPFRFLLQALCRLVRKDEAGAAVHSPSR